MTAGNPFQVVAFMLQQLNKSFWRKIHEVKILRATRWSYFLKNKIT